MIDLFAWPLNEGPNIERREKPRISGHALYLDYVRVANELALKHAMVVHLQEEITELRAKVAAYAAKEN